MTEFKKRSGSMIREQNINIVIKMLKEGTSEADILTELAMSFCNDTRTDYLNTAKEKLKIELKNGNSAITQPQEEKPKEPQEETALEYMKKHPEKHDESNIVIPKIRLHHSEKLNPDEKVGKYLD
jgi:hypothetical protein